MRKHTSEPPKTEEQVADEKLESSQVAKGSPLEQATSSSLVKSDSPTALRELLEKNLKWSQIIYEQNRKINNKLLWSAIANWVRVFILLVPFILAAIFLPPIIRDFKDRYFSWFQKVQSGQNSSEELINLLPLNATERERVKAMLK